MASQLYKGKIAVITGAASEIGKGLAERCAKENMKVVLADIEKKSLLQLEKILRDKGCEVLSVLTDVSKEHSVKQLANKTIDAFGGIHFLFNNAGVGVDAISHLITDMANQ